MNHPLHDPRGEQKEQKLTLVNEQGQDIGFATREDCHRGKGKPHRAFLAFLLTPDNAVILTRRSGHKSLWSGFWDASVVSHVLPGETSTQAAARRAKEELGISAIFTDIGAFYYFAPHGDSAENEYCHVLVGHTPEKIHANPVEISEIMSLPVSRLQTYLAEHRDQCAPWFILAVEKFCSQIV